MSGNWETEGRRAKFVNDCYVQGISYLPPKHRPAMSSHEDHVLRAAAGDIWICIVHSLDSFMWGS